MDAIAKPEWFPEPTVEFFDDEVGRTESAYIGLRSGKYATVVQPDPERLVFLYVGRDGLPIGIRLLEPAPGALGTEVLVRLASPVEPGAGEAPGDLRRDDWPLERLEKALHELARANARLRAVATP